MRAEVTLQGTAGVFWEASACFPTVLKKMWAGSDQDDHRERGSKGIVIGKQTMVGRRELGRVMFIVLFFLKTKVKKENVVHLRAWCD